MNFTNIYNVVVKIVIYRKEENCLNSQNDLRELFSLF